MSARGEVAAILANIRGMSIDAGELRRTIRERRVNRMVAELRELGHPKLAARLVQMEGGSSTQPERKRRTA